MTHRPAVGGSAPTRARTLQRDRAKLRVAAERRLSPLLLTAAVLAAIVWAFLDAAAWDDARGLDSAGHPLELSTDTAGGAR